MNASRIRNLLTNVRANLLQALEEQDELLAYVADTPLEARAAALMPEAKQAALLATAEDYANAADMITARIDNVDTTW